ncbi:hypothetical protein ACHAXR_006160 [Thalassiosira sp. AJA248-18]
MVAAPQYFLGTSAILLALSVLEVQSFQPIVVSSKRLQINNFHQLLHPTFINTKLNAAHVTPSNVKSRRRKKKPSFMKKKQLKNPNELETWRVYGLDVNPDDLFTSSTAEKRTEKDDDSVPPELSYLTPPVLSALLSRLRIKSDFLERDIAKEDLDRISLPSQLKDARVVRRSLDARRRRGSDPKYTYVIDIILTREAVQDLRLSHQPGRIERISGKQTNSENDVSSDKGDRSDSKPKIIIVGAGPAGLFCALSLASSGLFTPILLERGQPVEARGKSIGALIHRREIDPESNFSFGEGGAGTWSDGKLTTRIGRNSGPVRFVLETLVKYGAPKRILVEGGPHLGTDNLVRLLRNMREDLRCVGDGGRNPFWHMVSIYSALLQFPWHNSHIYAFSSVNKFHIEDGQIKSVDAKCTPAIERFTNNDGRKDITLQEESTKHFSGDAVVLATGHSARDVYYELHNSGVELDAKGFAVGFRIEHPQCLINEIQYGKDWGGRVVSAHIFTRKLSTDAANTKHFADDADKSASHTGKLPVASYRLATNEAFDGESNRGAYSFCQCPGGQIVPSSTEEGELCINGMSFSKRDSMWANSALVVTVSPDDPILEKYRLSHGNLAGLEFQREMERKAYELGGGGMRVPVQRLTDFLEKKTSASVPSSSYRLGVTSAACHDIYPQPLYDALAHAIIHHFDKQMPGFLCDQALLHGVETRTSSPVRVRRDQRSLQASGVDNLFPAGEGAGFAGGIVSAAVDGLLVANAIKTKFSSAHDMSQLFNDDNRASVGFDY